MAGVRVHHIPRLKSQRFKLQHRGAQHTHIFQSGHIVGKARELWCLCALDVLAAVYHIRRHPVPRAALLLLLLLSNNHIYGDNATVGKTPILTKGFCQI